MESGQSTYQQGESFHWDKRDFLIKKHKKRGVLQLPMKSSNGRNDDVIRIYVLKYPFQSYSNYIYYAIIA